MEIFQGLEGFSGIAVGKIRVLKKAAADGQTAEKKNIDKENEEKRYRISKERVCNELHSIVQQAEVDNQREQKNASTRLMLLNDHQFEDAIIGRIYQGNTAQAAIAGAGAYLEELLGGQEDSYLQSKSLDIRQLTKRLLTCMDGYDGVDAYLTEKCIIAVESLSSADFLKLDKDKVIGLIVEHSSANSHMAILAKAMNIPTILGCEVDEAWDGKKAVVDGGWRVLYLEPDDVTIADMEIRLKEENEKKQELLNLKGKECVTKDGKKISLVANICSPREVSMVLSNDAEGVGLYRTEPAYINRMEAPAEDELYEEYKYLAAKLAGSQAIIRTVDIGLDHEIPFVPMRAEVNSALGCRGIRLSLRHPTLFKTQIRAVLRAAVYGNLAVMFPMVSTLKELTQAREVVDACHRELIMEEIPCRDIQVGVMIETPAAAMISDELAKCADFFSIGTNDLTQYILGADRENKELSDIIDYHHPAILRMIKMTVENGHKAGIPVGICGELAHDDKLLKYFIDLGVDSLSVAPGNILQLRNLIVSM